MVLPILILIVVAILELGLAFKDFLTVSYLSREGARIAALAGDDSEADCAVLRGLGELATTSDLERIDSVQIFKADEGTGNQGLTNTAYYVPGKDPTICNIPSDPSTDGWSFASPIQWDPSSRQVTVGSNSLDIVGVRITLTHDWITGLAPFSGTAQVDETTITRLEPKVFE